MKAVEYYSGEAIDSVQFPDTGLRKIGSVVRSVKIIDGYREVVDRNTDRTYAIVKDGYVLVRHEDVLSGMDTVCAEYPEFGVPDKEIWFSNYGGRMKVRYTFKDVPMEIGTLADGTPDIVHPTYEAMCSYDTSLAQYILMGGLRFVCTNGLVVGKVLGEYKRKHTAGLDLAKAKTIISNGMENYSKATNLWISYTKRNAFMNEVNAYEILGFQKAEKLSIESEIKKVGNVIKWDEEPEGREVEINAWQLLNIYTAEASHRITDITRRAKVQSDVAKLFNN